MLYYFARSASGWLVEHNLDWAFTILYQDQFRALAAAGLSFLLVILFGRRAIRTLTRLKIGDTGLTDARALEKAAGSKANTPTMGGVLIAGAIGVSVVLLADIREFYVISALVVLAWLAALGGVDDWLKLTGARRGGGRQGLHAWEKLVFQIGIGLLVALFAFRHGDSTAPHDLAHVLNLPFQKTYVGTGLANPSLLYLPQWAFIVIAVLMVAGMSNAVNITDGMDGLASGVTVAVALAVCVLALIAGELKAAQYLLVPHVPGANELGVVAGAMAGACLGFLWWNCSPAQVFMGDTGALCLGGLLGYIAVVIRQEVVVLLMSGVFLIEIASVALQVGYFRLSGGKRIFRVAPFHHHLHLGGWTEQQIVARAWIVAIILAVAGLASLKVR
ncbi:MAG: phospho-N-acetylmuramoyl-pentapeptide-transferase [Phycisphaerales bacterium]